MSGQLTEAEIAELERMAGAPEPGANPVEPTDGGTPPTPPVVDNTPGQEPPTNPPAEPTIPEGYVKFNEVFQGYEKPEDVLSTLTKAKEYEQKVAELSSKLSSYNSNLLPGETEELYKLRMINQKNPEKFDLAKKLINNSLDPLGMIKESLKNNPDMEGLSDEDLDLYISGMYSVEKPDDEDDEVAMSKYNEKVRRIEVQKKVDAAKAKNDLMKIFSDIQLPTPKSEEELKAEQLKKAESFVATWKPVFQDAITAPIKISAPVPGEDGKTSSLVDIEVPADIKQQYLKDIGDVFYNSNVELNEKSRNSVTEYIQKRYINEHWEEVISTVAQTVREMSDAEWMKIKFNPRNPQGVSNTSAPVPNKITTESAFEADFKNL